MKIRGDIVAVTGLFWDQNMRPIVRRVPRALAAGMLAEILRQFAGLKAGTICDTDGTAFYSAAGQYLFTVPARAGEVQP
jgi:predicted benzoate:H+ symporter BenE